MDSLLNENKGFSLVELLVTIAVLIIIMGAAALTMGTALRDSRTKKAAFNFKTMLVDGEKTAMTEYRQVIVEATTQGIQMYLDSDESFSYTSGNDRFLALFIADGSSKDPGKPSGLPGDYYFIPGVRIVNSIAGVGTAIDLAALYGEGFEQVPVLDANAIIILRPEGVNNIKIGINEHTAGIICFRHIKDIDEDSLERQYLVLITKTFIKILKLEDDGTGNFVPKEL